MDDCELLSSVAWASKPLFNLDVTRDAVVAKLGEPTLRDLDSNGLGNFDAWPIRFACGLEVGLCWFTGDLVRSHRLVVHANDRERGHILFHLGFDGPEPSLWEPDTSFYGPERWQILRLDDNGNSVELSTVTSECEAKAVVATFERRGHKQTYWYRPRGGGGAVS